MNALLALFIRSLRELLRSKLSYWMLSGTIGLIFLFLLGASASATATAAPGLRFFQNSLFVVLAFITLAGVSYFASAITEEKEEGTLGLLRMTDLDPLAILLGKGTSRLGGALLLLAATMPFTFLAVTLGGISARQVIASYLCLGAWLVLLANLALLVSVLSPRGAIASAVMAGVVLGGSAIGALLKAAPAWIAKLPFGANAAFLAPAFTSAAGVIETVNPFRRLGAVLTTGWAGAMVDAQFWWSLALAAACLAVAWLVFDLATGEAAQSAVPRLVPRPLATDADEGSRKPGNQEKAVRRSSLSWLPGFLLSLSASWRQRFAPGRAWLVSALAWKDYHFLHGGRLLATVKWVGYSLPLPFIAWSDYTVRGDVSKIGSFVFWMMTLFLAVELVFIGSRIVRTELREQTLTGLAGLPLAMQHVMLMKLDGARRSLAPAFSLMCLGAGIMLVGSIIPAAPTRTGVIGTLLVWGYVASQVWLLAHLAAYFSLRMNWGALPVSLAILFAANIVGVFMCIGIFVMPILALTYVPQLRTTICHRLEELAAED